MRDLTSPRVMAIKAALFIITGVLASAGLLLEVPSIRTAVLLSLAIWGFCRAYYFAFYVVEHYIDPGYRFAGLWDFSRYAWRKLRIRP